MATVPAADVSTLLASIKTPFGEASRNRFKKNDFFFRKYRLNFLPPIHDRQCLRDTGDPVLKNGLIAL